MTRPLLFSLKDAATEVWGDRASLPPDDRKRAILSDKERLRRWFHSGRIDGQKIGGTIWIKTSDRLFNDG
jgi:hypothetical protein